MASIETPAIRTIIAHKQELTIALSIDPELIAGILFSTNFIQDDVLLKVSNDDTPIGKAAILLEAVANEIEIVPEKFTEFHKIVSENLSVVEVVDGLLSTYQSEYFFAEKFNSCRSIGAGVVGLL